MGSKEKGNDLNPQCVERKKAAESTEKRHWRETGRAKIFKNNARSVTVNGGAARAVRICVPV